MKSPRKQNKRQKQRYIDRQKAGEKRIEIRTLVQEVQHPNNKTFRMREHRKQREDKYQEIIQECTRYLRKVFKYQIKKIKQHLLLFKMDQQGLNLMLLLQINKSANQGTIYMKQQF